MHPALWVSVTGLDAQDTNVRVISNNLANVSTTGYKKSRAVFEDLFYQNVRQPGAQATEQNEIPSGLMLGAGVRTLATQKII
ncbi:MAG TPA: flagellar basal body protein [Candidatus Berkiella sp.]|nr:flagellar basal body protein [Candidatus Berkiella sp.]